MRKRNGYSRILAILLCTVLLVYLFPIAARADEIESAGQETTGQTESQSQPESSAEGESESLSQENGEEDGNGGGGTGKTQVPAALPGNSEAKYRQVEGWPAAPEVECDGAILIDAQTGLILYGKNEHQQYYPASITKIMTGLLAAELLDPSDVITYSSEAIFSLQSGAAAVGIDVGEQLSVQDSMNAMLIYSANDAANGLAEKAGGTIENFVTLMNERAAELGALNTHFVNANGLHEEGHVTTPYDMAMIMRGCVQNEEFMVTAGTAVATVPVTNKRSETYTYRNRHHMLDPVQAEYDPDVKAGKTGYTSQAKNTLVTYKEKDGMGLICVVMHGDGNGSIYRDTKALFDYGFGNFHASSISENETRYTLDSEGFFSDDTRFFGNDTVSIQFNDDDYIILPDNADFMSTESELTYLDESQQENGNFAQVLYRYNGLEVGTGRLRLISNQEQSFDFEAHEETQIQTESAEASGNQVTVIQVDVKKVLIVAGGVAAVFLIIFVIVRFSRGKKRRIRQKRRNQKLKFKADKRVKF